MIVQQLSQEKVRLVGKKKPCTQYVVVLNFMIFLFNTLHTNFETSTQSHEIDSQP